jgi:CPA1 family monovalent cation:H+ antiporter
MAIHDSILYIVAILGAALVVGIIAERLNLPYIVALLVASLPLSFQGTDEAFVESFLLLLLPTLIFEAAWNFHAGELRSAWPAVAFMAVPGVVLTVVLVGAGLAMAGFMPFLPGLLLGAIVAPTDPIAVIATFKRLAVPLRLAVTVEGESLFNDGVGVVLYAALALAVVSGTAPDPVALSIKVVFVALGGAAIGAVLAAACFFLVRLATDRDLHIVSTIVAAFGGYLLAEQVHLSGIFAALLAGITYRTLERRLGADHQTAEHVNTFWSTAAFLANTIVFLFVGLRIEVPRVLAHPQLELLTFGLVILARVGIVYGVLPFVGVARLAWRHVIALSGIRGGISIALALSLPLTTPYRQEILDAVYGVVGGTILIQGLALGPIMQRLRL